MAKMICSSENKALELHRGVFHDPKRQAAYGRLMRDVLGLKTDATPAEPWTPFALFEPDGRCVGNVDAAVLPLVLDGVETQISGLRSVAVDPAWRGRGLFRDLMNEALAWCEARSAVPTFLYTEDPALYERFGFRHVPQHAFAGAAPAPAPTRGVCGRRLNLADATDRGIICDSVARRGPVSSQCALGIDAAQFMANLAKDTPPAVAYVAASDTVIVYEVDEEELVIVDIVTPVMPDLAAVLGALRLCPKQVKVLFPTDKLGWHGTATPEDTGLMVRGPVAAAMKRPFMIPPTAEF